MESLLSQKEEKSYAETGHEIFKTYIRTDNNSMYCGIASVLGVGRVEGAFNKINDDSVAMDKLQEASLIAATNLPGLHHDRARPCPSVPPAEFLPGIAGVAPQTRPVDGEVQGGDGIPHAGDCRMVALPDC